MIYPIVGSDGSSLGLYFEGAARYTYTSVDPADLAVLPANLERTGNDDLWHTGQVRDRVERFVAFFARPPR